MSKFVIFANARTGSSSLALVLGDSKDVKLSFEPFHPKYPEWNPGEKDYSKLIVDRQTMNKYLDELFEKFNALKVLSYQLSSDIYFELLKRKEIKVLFLRRKNLLDMAISQMVAAQTGEWQKAKDDGIYDKLKVLDIKELKNRIDYAKELNEKYYKFLQKNRKDDYLPLWYEEIYSENLEKNIETIQEICEYVEISMPSVEAIEKYTNPAKSKSNYKNIYDNIPNLQEIKSEFKVYSS